MPRQLAPVWEALREGCGSCRFGRHIPNAVTDDRSVICRRYPPGILSDPWNPIDGWCGEWQRAQALPATESEAA